MAEEQLQPISLHLEMQRSYLEYAMSVIVGRALPDARDGLKPVQRRILFAMHELGLTPERPFRKCARVVGDVLGKYHPHGDQAVYDALVRLVQPFSSRYPILDGHGNFGSIDDDPAAAMRYTETRMASIAHTTLLDEINNDTVDFISNFDGSQQEPSVLPAQLPFLLLNGCSGIAVGMATSIPPHNINEIINALIALIQNPELTNEKLFSIIPGPDFPTGGEVLLGTGIRETYIKGRGSIPMRGIAHIEEIQPGKGKHKRTAIIVTELPYQISKASWIEKLADLVNENKISGISDIRDESDRDGMRIVIELRRDSDPKKILNILYKRTSLQNNFGAILLALVNGQPKQLSLREFLNTFLEYRENTIIRRTKFLLTKIENRIETLGGLIKALNNLRQVIEMIERAQDSVAAKASLMVNLNINEKQADAVLSMPLRKLTSLEQNSLREEAKNLDIEKNDLKRLLENRKELMNILIKELKIIKKNFGDKRKTRLIEGGDELLAEKAASQRPNAEVQRKNAFDALPSEGKLIIQQDYQVKIISPQTLKRLHLDKKCEIDNLSIISARLLIPIDSSPRILAVTSTGRIALVKWEFAGQQPGKLERFLPGGLEGEAIRAIFPLPKNRNLSLGLLSSDGRLKRLAVEEILDLSGRASTILKLKEGVHLISAVMCDVEMNIILVSSIGRILKMPVNDEVLPLMGKLAQGPICMKLLPGETIIGSIASPNNEKESLLIVTRKGKFYKIDIDSLRSCKKGNLGEMKNLDLDKDKIIDICNGNSLIGISTNIGRNGRIDSKEIYEYLNIQLKEDEEIVEIVTLINENQ